MNEYNYMSAALEYFAGIITLVMMIGCCVEKKKDLKTKKYFTLCLVSHMMMLFVDAPIWLLLVNPTPEKVVPIKILSFISDACFSAVISLYAYSLTEYISERKKITYCYAHVLSALCLISTMLWFINIFNEMYITYDENGLDHDGMLCYLSQIINIVLPASTMIVTLMHHKTLGWKKTWILFSYGAIPVVSISLQIFWAVTPVYLATTVSLLVVYTSLRVEIVERSAYIEKQLVKKELALAESKHSLVLSQIQPHFLYNVLTSIYYLCDTNPEEAKKAVSEFSKYLRGNLDSIKQTEMISFSDELNHLQAYLSLEKLRYGDYLHIRYHITITEFLIPPLTVQPLVENAVHHGISDRIDGGTVSIFTEEKPDCYEVRILDDGVGFDPDSLPEDGRSHIGISTVRSRLQIMCDGTLDIKSEKGKGTAAIIRIPKGDAKNEHYSR